MPNDLNLWQPIDSAPKDGTWIMLYCPDGDLIGDRYSADCWEPDSPDATGADGYWLLTEDAPTHWMSLPAPPRSSLTPIGE